MDLAALFVVVEDAEIVRSGPYVDSTMVLITKPRQKGLWGEVKEMGDPLHFFLVNRDPALTVTAISAHAAVKGFHHIYMK